MSLCVIIIGSQRKGRHLQRYGRDQERLVAGCIPVRGDTPEGVQVLMITSSSGGKGLVFPKASSSLLGMIVVLEWKMSGDGAPGAPAVWTCGKGVHLHCEMDHTPGASPSNCWLSHGAAWGGAPSA